MDRLTLERRQVWLYLAAIAAGLAVGTALPAVAPIFDAALWPALALLLYATFVQMPMLALRKAARDGRFVCTALAGNFIVVPLIVWALLPWLPDDPALRLGVCLVLLVPCTDWFITFTHLGGGDATRAVALSPLLLILQLVLLPFYLWWLAAPGEVPALAASDLAPALAIVLVPLALAALSDRWMKARPARTALRDRLAWWPVPLLAIVVFLIAGANMPAVKAAGVLLPAVIPVFVAYLAAAALAARVLAQGCRLPTAQGRTLAFSMGTRNSFVMLPLALSLPAGWEAVALVIIAQSLVELLGMVVYLRWIPNRLFREREAAGR